MQRYLWPGFEMQLLGGLQRQQNSAQFCDTLLQSEGVSVPTHSCILAALSPYLSQKLSASPSPPSGQKRQLQLQAVKAQTLLKLVGLLYSGVLEVKGDKEKSDVLAAAHQFGITDLVQGRRDGVRRESPGNCRERQGILKIQDAHVEAEMAGKGEKNSAVRKKSCVSVGTQTVTISENSVDSSAFLSGQSKPPNPEPAASVAQSLDACVTVPHQIIAPCPTIPSDGESTFGRSSDSVTNPTSTSALSTDTVTFPAFLNHSSSSETQEDCNQDSSESEDNIQWWAKERAALEDGKRKSSTSENERNSEEPLQVCRDEINRKEDSTEKNHSSCNAGVKKITKMKEVMQTTQISIKVKLRRRSTGELWEVVNIQSPDETLSVVTSVTQDCSYKKPQTDEEVQPPPSPAHSCPVQNSDIRNLAPAVTKSSKQPEHHNTTTSDYQSFSSSSFTSVHNSAPESVPLPHAQDSVDESDEQIEKLLEDIMMGLNILPNLESDCKKSEPSHGGAPAVCRVPVTASAAGQTQMDAAECVFYQDFGAQNDHTSADTVPDQPGCTRFPAVQPDGLIQQQEPRSPRYYSPVRSLGQIDGGSCQGLPLSKSQNSLNPEASASSVLSSGFFSSGQKINYPTFQPPSSQDDRHSLIVLPLSNGNGTQPEPIFSLPCVDDLRLHRCLSPLEPRSGSKSQPLLNSSANPKHDVQQQPSLRRQPWLSENPGSLKFQFSSITATVGKSTSLPPDPHRSCQLKERQEEEVSNPKNGGVSAEGRPVNSLKDRGIKSAAELKSYSRRIKESFRYKHDDTAGSRRERKRTNHRQDATGSCSAHKNVKVGDGIKSCSVRLSSNNVLVKEREMALMSANMRRGLVGKPRKMSTVIESEEEQPKESSGTKGTRIRTRGFVKKSQEAASNTTPSEKSRIFKPAVFSAQLGNQQGVSLQKRKRGRPRKIKLEQGSSESLPVIVENKGDCVNHEQVDWDLSKEETDKKTEKTCRKRRWNKSEVEVIPLKKIESAECSGKAEEATNNDIRPGPPKQWHAVTLKEFQKFINRQHSKRRKPNERQETRRPARDAESKARLNADGRLEKKAGIEERKNAEQHHEGSNIAVDQNHNNLSNTSAAQCCGSRDEGSFSVSEGGSLDGDGDHPVSFDVGDEDAAKVTTEGEQPLKGPHEGMTGDLMESPIKAEGSSHSDALLPTLDCTLLPRTLETAAPPLSNADGISRASGKEEDEEEEEVDVLAYSPEKAAQTRGCGDGRLSNIDVTPDEDEEEDVNEINVTGDEAE